MGKQIWTLEEDRICCEICVREFVKIKNDLTSEECLTLIQEHEEISKRDRSSIRMRLQNIKSLLEEWEISNNLPLKSLTNAAKQTRDILAEELLKAGIRI